MKTWARGNSPLQLFELLNCERLNCEYGVSVQKKYEY